MLNLNPKGAISAMIFRADNKEYRAATAVEIVLQMAREAVGFTARTGDVFLEFLHWSLNGLKDCLPPRELDLSPRVSDEVLALGYLSLRHQYGIGEIVDAKPV